MKYVVVTDEETGEEVKRRNITGWETKDVRREVKRLNKRYATEGDKS